MDSHNKNSHNFLMSTSSVPIAIIGGTGFYDLPGLTFEAHAFPTTPWGTPSDQISIFTTASGGRVAFLPRHGNHHQFNPSSVPFRANMAALKSLGVRVVLAFSAVGSLREEIRPGDFVLASQSVDWTKGVRKGTFFDDGVVGYAPFADPYNEELAELIERVCTEEVDGLTIHRGKTLVTIEGPTFSTRAESHMFRDMCKGDVISMSNIPESKLAREAELSYQIVCMATDYDCWREELEPVSADAVMQTMKTNVQWARLLITKVIPHVERALQQGQLRKDIEGCMRFAVMNKREDMSADALGRMQYILPEYYA
jgi:5'-methylthioadenosine phosphorylase